MKSILKILSFAGLIILFSTSFTDVTSGAIKGMVSPATGATRVIATSKTDTVRSNIYQGIFEIPNLQPGTYSLTVVAIPPYKNGYKNLVSVVNGVTTDVGYFILEK